MRRGIAIGAAAITTVAGAGGAIAATRHAPEAERDAVVADVAKELGVTPERVRQALRGALANRVDAAVAAGRLSEAEGAALKERIRAGELPRLGLGHRRGAHAHGRGELLRTAAEYLGATATEVREARRDGRSLASLAEARGKSVSGLEAALVAAHKQRLDAAVVAGRLTQEQADRRAAEFAERVGKLVRADGPPHERGPHRP